MRTSNLVIYKMHRQQLQHILSQMVSVMNQTDYVLYSLPPPSGETHVISCEVPRVGRYCKTVHARDIRGGKGLTFS